MIRTLLYKTYRQVEFMFFVSMITGLVWLYAEAGNVTPHEQQAFNIEFVGPAGKQLAIEPAGLVGVKMSFRCATDQYDLFKTATQGGLKINVVEIPSHPQQTVLLKDRLQAIFPSINITEVDPQSVPLDVESLKSFTAKIRLAPPDDNPDITLSPPDPTQVTISLPASAKVPADAFILGRLDPNQLNNLLNNLKANDPPAPVDVNFSLPDWARPYKDAAITPVKATVLVTLKAPTANTGVMSLSVMIEALPQDLRTYDFAVGDGGYVRNITFTGPSTVIADIKSGKTKVWAVLELEQKDIEDALKSTTGGSKTPIIKAPQNVTFNIPTPVTFTVTPRKQP